MRNLPAPNQAELLRAKAHGDASNRFMIIDLNRPALNRAERRARAHLKQRAARKGQA